MSNVNEQQQQLENLFQGFKEEMKTHVEESIRLTVNGKIDKIKEMNVEQNKQIESIKENTDEVIEILKGAKIVTKYIINFLKFVKFVGVPLTFIYAAIKFLVK